ncbi:MAG: ATP synthase F1 subunit delta [Candidatus Doudnabacteria bacterium]
MKAEQYAQALYDALNESKPEDHEKILDNLVRVLSQNGDLKLYDQIEEQYKRIEAEGKGIKQVEITTAQPHRSREILEHLNKIVGDKVDVKEKIDEDLIGGVVVRVDDTLIDGSIKNSLKQLRKAISK